MVRPNTWRQDSAECVEMVLCLNPFVKYIWYDIKVYLLGIISTWLGIMVTSYIISFYDYLTKRVYIINSIN